MKSFSRPLLKNRALSGARLAVLAVLPVAVLPLSAAVNVTLSTPEISLPVGSTFHMTATASDTASSSATFTYLFAVRSSTSASYDVIKNFYKTNTADWTALVQEGTYDLQVVVQSSSGSVGYGLETLVVTSRVTGSNPVVSHTRNPLVALYSAPPCASPNQVLVAFKTADATSYRTTLFKPCTGQSLNFYIAGMLANTTYHLHQDLYNGSSLISQGPVLTFTTGPIGIAIPSHSYLAPLQPPTQYTYPNLLWLSLLSNPFVTDNRQNVIWYFSPPGSASVVRPIGGVTFLGMADEPTAVCPQNSAHCSDHQFFREYDLAGNVLRETNWTFLNQQVNASRAFEGKAPVHLTSFHHDGIRLPSGDTVTFASDEETADQGDGPVDVLGDVVVVLDSNFQLKHYWDEFDYLDIKRKALLNDVCVATPQPGGCPIIYGKQSNGKYYTQANDWTHSNSLAYDPKDGNLVVSIRHQAWVIKLDYRNGSGSLNLLWKLGQDGDFTLSTGNPLDWFSYQHNAEFQSNGALTLFDNGNFRVSEQHGGNSRGQAWSLDETKHIATPILNADLGVFSMALGSAKRLSNGNYTFDAGNVNGSSSQTSEFDATGSLVSRERLGAVSYRSFRASSMYGPY